MMQQPIEDGRADDRIAEDRTPLAIALVGSENDAAPLITGADELEEDVPVCCPADSRGLAAGEARFCPRTGRTAKLDAPGEG